MRYIAFHSNAVFLMEQMYNQVVQSVCCSLSFPWRFSLSQMHSPNAGPWVWVIYFFFYESHFSLCSVSSDSNWYSLAFNFDFCSCSPQLVCILNFFFLKVISWEGWTLIFQFSNISKQCLAVHCKTVQKLTTFVPAKHCKSWMEEPCNLKALQNLLR